MSKADEFVSPYNTPYNTFDAYTLEFSCSMQTEAYRRKYKRDSQGNWGHARTKTTRSLHDDRVIAAGVWPKRPLPVPVDYEAAAITVLVSLVFSFRVVVRFYFPCRTACHEISRLARANVLSRKSLC